MQINLLCSKNSLILCWNFVIWRPNKCLVIQETSWCNNQCEITTLNCTEIRSTEGQREHHLPWPQKSYDHLLCVNTRAQSNKHRASVRATVRQSLRIRLGSNCLPMLEWQTHPHQWLERDLHKWGMPGQYGRIGFKSTAYIPPHKTL